VRTIILFLATVMLGLPQISLRAQAQMQSSGQTNDGGMMQGMAGMNSMVDMNAAAPASKGAAAMDMQSHSFIGFLQSHSTSGTDATTRPRSVASACCREK